MWVFKNSYHKSKASTISVHKWERSERVGYNIFTPGLYILQNYEGGTLGKFGRKICCNFDNNVKCILLIDGNKRCVLDETTEEQHKNGKVQFSICPLLPDSERNGFLAEMEKKGYRNFRSFKT